MSFETPDTNPPQEDEQTNPIIEQRDRLRESANDLQKGVGEIQSARYESVLYEAMDRAQTNPELVNAMRDFINALERSVMFGNSSEPMDPRRVKKLADYFREQTNRLENPENFFA